MGLLREAAVDPTTRQLDTAWGAADTDSIWLDNTGAPFVIMQNGSAYVPVLAGVQNFQLDVKPTGALRQAPKGYKLSLTQA